MTPRQQRVLDEVREASLAVRRYEDWTPDKIEADEFFAAVLEEYDRAIGAALRAGFKDHPLVSPWLTAHKALGQRDLLRRLQKGLETGVRRPSKFADVLLEIAVLPLIQAGCKPKMIRKLVIAKMLALAADDERSTECRQAARELAKELKQTRQTRQAWPKRLKSLAGRLQAPLRPRKVST